MALLQVFASRKPYNASTYVAHKGLLFYDEVIGTLRLGDGITAGGIPAGISVATTTTIGGIKAGAGVVVGSDGLVTLDAAGLPISFGDFYANANNLSTINTNEDFNILSNGTGTVNVVGNFHVHSTTLGGLSSPGVFQVKSDGQIKMLVPAADQFVGAVEIIGGLDGVFQIPVNTGVMLHVTGIASQGGTPIVSRIYNDSQGTYALYAGRRFNGTATNPTPVLAGQDIARYAGTGYTSAGWQAIGSARMSLKALEDFTGTAQGGAIEFNVIPLGATASAIVTATTITATGTTSLRFFGPLTGNLSGNVSGTAITATNIYGTLSTADQSNITTVGTLTNLAITAGGTITTPTLTYNDGGIRRLGSTATVTVNFATDSVVEVIDPPGIVTVNLTNFAAGRTTKVLISFSTHYAVNLGVAAAKNSTLGTVTLASNKLVDNQLVALDYTCINGTSATTYVQVHYV